MGKQNKNENNTTEKFASDLKISSNLGQVSPSGLKISSNPGLVSMMLPERQYPGNSSFISCSLRFTLNILGALGGMVVSGGLGGVGTEGGIRDVATRISTGAATNVVFPQPGGPWLSCYCPMSDISEKILGRSLL